MRSERRLCEEVHLNLAYRWFCRLGLDGAVPDHLTFSKNRHGRFRDSDLSRELFEITVTRCIEEGLVGGGGFAVDASLIKADANRQRGVPGEDSPETITTDGPPAIQTTRAGRARFRQMKALQKFASVHGSIHNHLNQERHLVDRQTFELRRSAALAEWQSLMD